MQGTKQAQEIRIGVAHFLAKHACKVLSSDFALNLVVSDVTLPD
jgi:hypothetical protein